ncbi:MAG: helix-turn-helix domain-containing protein [Anaerolineales bacterium]|nr:helix-turn-helix domain-containing protein [Anaerolineales bacterium]
MMVIKEIEPHWNALSPLFVIRNEAEYEQALDRLDALIDEVGTDEQHSLYELLDTLGTIVHAYEEAHYQLPPSSGVGVLHYLMEEHGLTQSELPEVGSQGVVSEILSGKRQLNVRQIQGLAARFGVSPAVFFD